LFQSQEHSQDRSEMYLCLHSSQSQDSRFGPASGDNFTCLSNFSSRSHVNIY
jgi:hypothetical protein